MPTRIVPASQRKRSLHVSLTPQSWDWVDRMAKHRAETRTQVIESLVRLVEHISKVVCS